MIKVELKGMDEAIAIYSEKPVKAAIRASIQRIAKTAITAASSGIRDIYNVKKQDLDPRLRMTMQGTEQATITISGKGMSLSYFGARQFVLNKTITRSRKDGRATLTTKRRSTMHKFQGVEVEVVKGRRVQLKSAFMAQMRSGHIGVMHRWNNGKMMKGKKKAAIGEKGVISIAYMAEKSGVLTMVVNKIQGDWEKVFQQQLAYQLNKGKATP